MSLIYINLDDVIFTPSVSKFNGEEIMSLIRHLGKCLKKYQRFPPASSCLKASSMLGLKVCDSIPTFEAKSAQYKLPTTANIAPTLQYCIFDVDHHLYCWCNFSTILESIEVNFKMLYDCFCSKGMKGVFEIIMRS